MVVMKRIFNFDLRTKVSNSMKKQCMISNEKVLLRIIHQPKAHILKRSQTIDIHKIHLKITMDHLDKGTYKDCQSLEVLEIIKDIKNKKSS